MAIARRSGPGRQALGLGVCLGASFAAAGLGSLFTRPAIEGWYAGLAKPWWTPPNGTFGPVWTALFAMMAVAAWLVWRRRAPGGRGALGLFAVQLMLNVVWSALFFGLRMPGAAFAHIVVLWLAIAATALAFRRVSPAAGLLLVPYLAWVGFAAALNFALWRLNA